MACRSGGSNGCADMILSPPCRDSVPLAQERGEMRRRRFQRGGLSQRKRNGRQYWYLQWRDDGQPKSRELGLVSEMTRAQAEVVRTAIMDPINQGLLKPANPVYTFEQHIEEVYFAVKVRGWKTSTARTTEEVIRVYLLPDLGPRLLTGFRREDLQGVLDRAAARGRSYSVVAHMRWQLSAIFKLAMGDGLVSIIQRQDCLRRSVKLQVRSLCYRGRMLFASLRCFRFVNV